MLIKIPQSVSIDNNDILSNIRLNLILDKRQVRFKSDINRSSKKIPVDIVVYSYTIPKIDIKGKISMNINGEDLINKRKIYLTISFHVTSKRWVVTGRYGWKDINESSSSISSIIKKYLIY